MSEKCKFKRVNCDSDKTLFCPNCYEMLFRHDIEHFAKCPYCNQNIEFDMELEDYLLKPVIDRWMTFQRYSSQQAAAMPEL